MGFGGESVCVRERASERQRQRGVGRKRKNEEQGACNPKRPPVRVATFFFKIVLSNPAVYFLLARFPIPHSLFTMMYEISALATTALPREAETTRRGGDESGEETERRRLDWPIANVTDRCCLLLGRAEAETAIAVRGAKERTGALAKGEEAREAMFIFWSNSAEKRFKG